MITFGRVERTPSSSSVEVRRDGNRIGTIQRYLDFWIVYGIDMACTGLPDRKTYGTLKDAKAAIRSQAAERK